MPAKIKQGSSKLVVRAQFDDKGRLQISGQVKKAKRDIPEHIEVLDMLGRTVSMFLKDLMKAEVKPEEAVSESNSDSPGSGDLPEQPPVS